MTLVPRVGPPPAAGAAALIERAVSATTTSITVSDPHQDDQPLVCVNPAFTAVTGYRPEEVLGRNCRFLQGPGTDPAAVARVRRALSEGRPVTEVLLNYRADGTTFYNELAVSPVLDERGRLTHFVAVQTDVTARVLAERGRAEALAAQRRTAAGLQLLLAVTDSVAEVDAPRGVAEVVSVLLEHEEVGWGASWACLWLADDPTRVLLGAVGAAGAPCVRQELQVALPTATTSRAAGPPGAPAAVAAVAAGTTPGPVQVPARGAWVDGPVGAWLADELAERWPCPSTAVALPGRGGPLGVLVLGAPHGLGAQGEVLLRDVARRVGLAVENDRLLARERTTAEVLQRSLLPPHVAVPGLDTWSYYQPGAEHTRVGGDWYDVLPLEGGGAGLVIGDVVGHDLEAAAAMGQVRSVVRACALDDHDPAAVVERVDRLLAGMGAPRPASLVYGVLVPSPGGRWRFTWTRAGHLPPVVVRAAPGGGGPRAVEPLDAGGGVLVGIGVGERTSCTVDLRPGDLLALCTDGLLERHDRPLAEGVALMARLCAGLAATTAAGAGSALLAGLATSPAEDDTAVVLVRVPVPDEPPGGPAQRGWQLPATLASTARSRRHAVRACREWGLDLAPQAELVVSELVANAVLHAEGPVGLRLRRVEEGLLVEVDDGSPQPPEQPPGAVRAHGGGHGLAVVRRLGELGWRREGAGKTVWALLRTR
jgi:PAS domain S-box-containing protein